MSRQNVYFFLIIGSQEFKILFFFLGATKGSSSCDRYIPWFGEIRHKDFQIGGKLKFTTGPVLGAFLSQGFLEIELKPLEKIPADLNS